MNGFAERFGFAEPIIELDESEMPESLRSGLWDAAKISFFANVAKYYSGRQDRLTEGFSHITQAIWFHFFRISLDEMDANGVARRSQLKSWFLKAKFFEVYGFIEFLANVDVSEYRGLEGGERFASFCNSILSREKSAFRFAGTILVRVSDEEELDEVSNAMSNRSSNAVRTHIRRAAELFGQRPEPDYRNSIKESISAVEASVREVAGKKTSGVSKPLKLIEESLRVHPALFQGFEKLYAFTSDAGGIRHAILDGNEVSEADARYMLIACSAFANFLLAKKIEG